MTIKTSNCLITILAFCTTACSTNPAMPSSELKQKLSNSKIIIVPINKPALLTERTKAQAIANMVVSSVVGSVVGSTGHAANMQQLQANMQIAQSFSQTLQQSLPDNYAIESGNGADLALAKKLFDFFGTEANGANKNQELYISVATPLWELGYVSLLSGNYELNYNLNLAIQEKVEEKFRSIKTVSCTGPFKENMPLDDWKSDNYKKVDIAAGAIVDECFNKFLTAINFNPI